MAAVQPAIGEGGAKGTPDELLDVAERLFAERGVENIALTEIVAAAGQKNRSAIHYHFGSRDGVLTAVLNRRLAPINARREAALGALPPGAGRAEIVRATMRALFEAAEFEPWGEDYVAILAQVMFHPRLLGQRAVDEALLSGVRRARKMIVAAAPTRAADDIEQRLDWLNQAVVFALARWLRDAPAAARTPAARDDLMDRLTAFGAAALSPSSQEPTP